ncbi:hypothetical protein HN51_013540 [Arachis hypogaea]
MLMEQIKSKSIKLVVIDHLKNKNFCDVFWANNITGSSLFLARHYQIKAQSPNTVWFLAAKSEVKAPRFRLGNSSKARTTGRAAGPPAKIRAKAPMQETAGRTATTRNESSETG